VRKPESSWKTGAVVTELDHGPVQGLGLPEHAIVVAIAGHDVSDAAMFAKPVDTEYAAFVDRPPRAR